MGLIDFVKNAGKKLFGKDDGGDQQAATQESAGVIEARKARALVREIREHGLEVEGLQVTVEGETATIGGKVDSQADREKVALVVGNVDGISRVNDRLEVESPEPAAAFYTVQRGDTLSAIAKAHYGNASKYPLIFEANKPMLTDPDKIYPGQVLRIPPLES